MRRIEITESEQPEITLGDILRNVVARRKADLLAKRVVEERELINSFQCYSEEFLRGNLPADVYQACLILVVNRGTNTEAKLKALAHYIMAGDSPNIIAGDSPIS